MIATKQLEVMNYSYKKFFNDAKRLRFKPASNAEV